MAEDDRQKSLTLQPRSGTEKALARGHDAADAAARAAEDWSARARGVVIEVAQNLGEFTTDDVWERMGDGDRETVGKRALGGVMLGLARDGLIHTTNRFLRSRRLRNHGRTVRVWESLIFSGEG